MVRDTENTPNVNSSFIRIRVTLLSSVESIVLYYTLLSGVRYVHCSVAFYSSTSVTISIVLPTHIFPLHERNLHCQHLSLAVVSNVQQCHINTITVQERLVPFVFSSIPQVHQSPLYSLLIVQHQSLSFVLVSTRCSVACSIFTVQLVNYIQRVFRARETKQLTETEFRTRRDRVPTEFRTPCTEPFIELGTRWTLLESRIMYSRQISYQCSELACTESLIEFRTLRDRVPNRFITRRDKSLTALRTCLDRVPSRVQNSPRQSPQQSLELAYKETLAEFRTHRV